MNNIYKRPMFRKGGSAEGGITSGLQRPGYNVGNRVTEVMDEMRTVMPQRNTPKRRFNDFLIDFGLDIATRTPTGSGIGGAISTALASAKDPFDKFKQSRAASEGFEDKLALGAYDVVKGEQAAEKDFEQKKDLIKLEAELNPKLKKVFREEIPFNFIKNIFRIANNFITWVLCPCTVYRRWQRNGVSNWHALSSSIGYCSLYYSSLYIHGGLSSCCIH